MVPRGTTAWGLGRCCAGYKTGAVATVFVLYHYNMIIKMSQTMLIITGDISIQRDALRRGLCRMRGGRGLIRHRLGYGRCRGAFSRGRGGRRRGAATACQQCHAADQGGAGQQTDTRFVSGHHDILYGLVVVVVELLALEGTPAVP